MSEGTIIIEAMYKQLINAWNDRNASGMAELFHPLGELIGFDGSLAVGTQGISDHLTPIFRDHPTPPYI